MDNNVALLDRLCVNNGYRLRGIARAAIQKAMEVRFVPEKELMYHMNSDAGI